jgi:hypothetical protein
MPFPVKASSGSRDGWSIYIDDFLDISILQRNELLGRLGLPSRSQSVVRDVYAGRGIPRNAPKSTVSSLTDEHVGYLFDGDNGDIGVRTARLLEIVSVGLLMLIRQSNPLLIYQVFTGKLAHSLQVRRPLWSFLQVFFEVFKDPEQQLTHRRMSGRGRLEIKALLCCFPLCSTRVRGSIDPVITCSDASLGGLGVSRSIGLAPGTSSSTPSLAVPTLGPRFRTVPVICGSLASCASGFSTASAVYVELWNGFVFE